MKFTESAMPGVVVIDIAPRSDTRGFFSRTFCAREFSARGMESVMVQANIAHTRRAGTCRGLHGQVPPSFEAKLIRCVRGAIFDVTVDLRPDSPTYLRYFAAELTAESRRSVYIPPGCAHGYQSLVDDVEIFYLTSDYYTPELEIGVRPEDPALGIDWPLPVVDVSEKDRRWPLIGERSRPGVPRVDL